MTWARPTRSSSGGIALVTGSPLLRSGGTYVWPGRGEVTPPAASDWTAGTWGAGGSGSLADAYGAALLTSSASGAYYGAWRSASNGQAHVFGWDWSCWGQTYAPQVMIGVEDTGGRSVLVGWGGNTTNGLARVFILCFAAPGTYAGFGRIDQPWIGAIPPFVRLNTAGGLVSFEFGMLSSAGPWSPLYTEAIGGAFLGATIDRVSVVAQPGNALAATATATPIRIPFLHYEVT